MAESQVTSPLPTCGYKLRTPCTFLNSRNSQTKIRISQRENYMKFKCQCPRSPVALGPALSFPVVRGWGTVAHEAPVCTAWSFSGDACQLQNKLVTDDALHTARQNHRCVLGTAASSSRSGLAPCGPEAGL